MARVPPNLHSVDVDSQSWLTERRESKKAGTQRTFRKIRRWMFPRASTASIGMSPTTEARCGLPSAPEITSSVGRRFTRSSL
eukprot:2079128-Pleurochrysis_carterae.AAC.1